MEKKSKLKIIIPIVIAIVILAVVIVIMPKGKMSKEEMLEVAQELNITEFTNTINDNILKAKETYNGNIYRYTGFVSNIETNYAEIGNIKVYLDKESLKTLNKNQKVEVVGKLENIDAEEEQKSVAGTTYEETKFTGEMKNAYIKNDIFEITGIVDVADEYKLVSSYSGKISETKRELKEWYCHIGNYDITEFSETKNFVNNIVEKNIVLGTEITDGNSVTITGKVFNITSNNAKYQIKDLKTIKVNAET